MKLIYTLLLLLFCAFITNAQKITVFNSSNSILPKEDGFGSTVVVDMQGNVWMFRPGYGNYKYDGQQFTHIDTLNKFTSPLFADREGNVWFGNGSTIIKFDGKNWVKYDKQQTGIQNGILTIAEAPSGKLYIGTMDGLYTFDGNSWQKISLPKPDMYVYWIRSIDIGPANSIAASCDQGLLLSDDDGKNWKVLNENNSKLVLSSMPVVKYAPTGELYIGYGGGPRNGGFSIVKNDKWKSYNSNNSKLPENMVRRIKFAEDSAIWMATNNGILKIKDNKWKAIKFTKSDNEPIIDLAIYHSILWISTLNGLIKYEE